MRILGFLGFAISQQKAKILRLKFSCRWAVFIRPNAILWSCYIVKALERVDGLVNAAGVTDHILSLRISNFVVGCAARSFVKSVGALGVGRMRQLLAADLIRRQR